MKRLVVFHMLLLSLAGHAQNTVVNISGVVKSQKDDEPVKDAKVFLKLSGGNDVMHVTDSTGRYAFTLFTDTSTTFILSVGSDKKTVSKTNPCGFLASRERIIGNLRESRHYRKDFVLQPVYHCNDISIRFLFYTNSLENYNDSLAAGDSVNNLRFATQYNYLCKILTENPGVVIQLDGHASAIEKNPELLALYRAQLIKEILVANKINPKRILVKSWGSQKRLVSDASIKKAKTDEEKKLLHAKNQRVVFRIVSWDFKE